MFKDYHYLLRCGIELKTELVGSKINSVFTQEKDTLYFHVPNHEKPNRFLINSTNSQSPYFLIKNEFFRAKKNTVGIFSNHFPSKILDVRISNTDRIVNISTETGNLFFIIRGNNSNVIFVDNNNELFFFKNSNFSKTDLLNEIYTNEFISAIEDYSIPEEPLSDSYKDIKSKLPFVSKKLYDEIIYRSNINSTGLSENLRFCIEEIFKGQIQVGIKQNENLIVFQPSTFFQDQFDEEKTFEKYNEALHYYFGMRFRYAKLFESKKRIITFLERELAVLSNRLNNLKIRVDNGSQDELYYMYGNLLLANIHLLKDSNSEYVDVTDYNTSNEIRIRLDKQKTIQENANSYFSKAKDEKKNFEKSKMLYDQSRIKYETYVNFRNRIEIINNPEEIRLMQQELNINENQKKENYNESPKFREYLIENKYKVYVGKDSKSNDQLTVYFAKQNDYWFHARGLPGSHVVLRVDNPKEGIPRNILNYAASIAAYHSKAKTAKVAPVSYTLRKFVRKNKNMNPGQVILTKESVLLVKPEIPKSAVEVEE